MKKKIPQKELELIARNLIDSWKKQELNTELSMLCTYFGMECPKCKQTPFWKQVSAYKTPEKEALTSQ